MKFAGRISFGSWLAALLLFSSLVSCARIDERRMSDERAVLASSSFYHGSLTPAVRGQVSQAHAASTSEVTGETGVIRNPNAPGNGGNDGGAIGTPGNGGVGTIGGTGDETPIPNPGTQTGDDTAANNPPNPGAGTPSNTNPKPKPSSGKGPRDGGQVGHNGDDDKGVDWGKIIRYELFRVCTWHGGYGFFEEARRPVLSIESDTLPSWCPAELEAFCGTTKTDPMQLAGVGSYPAPAVARKSVVLGRRDLSGVNLFADRYRGSMSLNFRDAKAAYGNKIRNLVLRTRVCDDGDGKGSCLGRSKEQTMSVIEMLIAADQIPTEFALEVLNGRIAYNPEYYAHRPEFCERIISPLVLDLQGDGISLSSPFEGVRFDLDDQGRPEISGWTLGADDAFLVYDRNRNGRIDSGAELFGSATVLRNGERASNGFEALKEFDSNGDGLFSKADADWSRMALWIDANRNGFSESNELMPLETYRLESVHLAYVDTNEVDPHGNQTRQRSTFRRLRDGISEAALIVDIWFRTLTAN